VVSATGDDFLSTVGARELKLFSFLLKD
jgi:hypothetical protein